MVVLARLKNPRFFESCRSEQVQRPPGLCVAKMQDVLRWTMLDKTREDFCVKARKLEMSRRKAIFYTVFSVSNALNLKRTAYCKAPLAIRCKRRNEKD